MKLSEIFLSIQGESSYAGLPCIFIRLSECNLRCNYCDSKFSYTPKFELTQAQTLEQIDKHNPVKLLEITGCEPLLQPEIYNLFDKLHQKNYTTLLETNGSINLANIPDFVHKIVDIKCPDSAEGDSFLENNINYINTERDEIKFVLSSPEDYIWMKKKISSIQN